MVAHFRTAIEGGNEVRFTWENLDRFLREYYLHVSHIPTREDLQSIFENFKVGRVIFEQLLFDVTTNDGVVWYAAATCRCCDYEIVVTFPYLKEESEGYLTSHDQVAMYAAPHIPSAYLEVTLGFLQESWGKYFHHQ